MNSSTVTFHNPTHYFVPTVSRSRITVSNPDLFTTAKQKREGYETRLYYEYERTLSLGGFAQFVTLTYNDKSLPHFFGIPCIDNQHIRYLFHDTRFFKDLKKNHGYNFKYFVCSEFGEGKGYHRKKGDNPHYHAILFFTPVPDVNVVDGDTGELSSVIRTPHHLTPKDVACAIRDYWQGYNVYYKDGKRKKRLISDPKKFKFGLVSFGKVHKYGLVQSFRALSYTSKYCVKDVYFKKKEEELYKKSSQIMSECLAKASILDTKEDIFESFKDVINKFRSRYSSRVLCSQGIGISALDQVTDTLNPRVKVATSKGFIQRSLPLYLYRKLYCDVKKDSTGSYYYTSNKLGKEYKSYHLFDSIDKVADKTRELVFNLYTFPILLDQYLNSDNHDGSFPYSSRNTFTHRYNVTKEELSRLKELYQSNISGDSGNVFSRYAIYKKIYSDRCFKFSSDTDSYPVLSFKSDYLRSLIDVHTDFFDSRNGIKSIIKKNTCPYETHPYFRDDISLFSWFDNLNSYEVLKADNADRERYEQQQKLKQIQNIINYA